MLFNIVISACFLPRARSWCIKLFCNLFSLGLARFAMCDPTDPPIQYSYTQSSLISGSNSCYQKLNVTEGRITLDTRIMYSPGGCCNCREEIIRFAIFKGAVTPPELYVCDDTPDSDCPNKNGVVVNRHSNLFYDFSIELQLDANDTAQLIYVEIEVDQPMLSNFRRFWKVFDVTVNQGEYTHTCTCTNIPQIGCGNRSYFLVLVWFVLFQHVIQ